MIRKIFCFFLFMLIPIFFASAEIIKLPNVGTYSGEIKDGKPHGKGILTYEDGEKYSGDWINGMREGKGTLIYIDGSKYDGRI